MYRKNDQNGYNHERYRVGGDGVAHNRKDKLAQIYFIFFLYNFNENVE